jgi:hypothetical protein
MEYEVNVHFQKTANLKPSTKFFAKALPHGSGFRGQFSAPGFVPALVGPADRPTLFETEDAAQLAAFQALEGALNARLEHRMRFERVQKMSAKELSEALDTADLTPTELGFIVQSERVMGWLDGTYDVPHMVRIIVGLCQKPENVDLAESIAGAALLPRGEDGRP